MQNIKSLYLITSLLFINSANASNIDASAATVAAPALNNTSVSLAASVKCTDEPCLIVQSSLQSLSQALNKGLEYKKLIKLIRSQILVNFDFMMIVKYSLGEYSSSIPEAQKQEIAKLFKEMLINAYTMQLYKFNHAKIKIVSSTIDETNPNQASIICNVKINNQTRPVSVEYLLNKSKSGWKIYDVTVDDVSVLSSFRIVFENVISSEGVDGLITLLKSDELSEQINEAINNQDTSGN